MDYDKFLNKHNILGCIYHPTFNKVESKLNESDFAILCHSMHKGSIVDSLNSQKVIRDSILANGIRSYNLLFRNGDELKESILYFRNTAIQSPGEFLAMTTKVSSEYTNQSFIVCLKRSEMRSVDIDGEQVYFQFNDCEVMDGIGRAYSNISGDGNNYKIIGISEPINNISRYTFNKYGISWL